MKTYAIGIDIGGTKISMVLGTRSGKILARRVISTRTGSQSKSCLEEIVKNLKELVRDSRVKQNKILGIGIGLPGPVDTRKGVVPRSPHLPGWKGFPLRKWLSKKMVLPVFMANDANAAAVGEKVFGMGKRFENFIYMTVSTGIGGGIIVGGKLVEGTSFVAGEVGHMTIMTDGNLCKCGKRGCLEAYASGTAIAAYVKNEMKKGRPTRIPNFVPKGKPLSARYIGLAAQSKDRLALEAYRVAGGYLGVGIANLLNILNPQRVILGGGVFKSAPPVFLKAMFESTKKEAWPQAFHAVKIVRTHLGDLVGDLGTLALVFENLLSEK